MSNIPKKGMMAFSLRPYLILILACTLHSMALQSVHPSFLILEWDEKTGTPFEQNASFLPGPEVADALKKQGFTWTCAKYSEQLDKAFLRQFNIVVVGLSEHAQTPMAQEKRQNLNQLLWDYLQDGGGLMVMRAPSWAFDRDLDLLNETLAPLGAKILGEQVADRKHTITTPSTARIYWTNNLVNHPVTDGVAGVFYPDGYSSYPAYTDFTSPVRTVATEWRVLVRGAKTASSYARPKGYPLNPETPGSYASEPPLLAVREYGLGRVAVCAINPSIFWQDGGHLFWGGRAILDGQFKGHPGNHLRLVENLFQYLAQPSLNRFGGYQSPPPQKTTEIGFGRINWDVDRHRGDYLPNRYRGLIGAQSALSSGTGDPEEFIAAAKASGYDFLAFLEPLELMTEEKFNRLKKVCQTASDDQFQAYPGLCWRDESGNQWGAFSDTMFWPRPEWFSRKHPGRLRVNNPATRGWGWPPVIMIAPGQNPEMPWLQGNFKAFALSTYRNGVLLEDSREIGMGLRQDCFEIYFVTVHFTDSPSAIAKAATPGLPQCWVRWLDNRVITAYTGSYLVHQGKYFWTRPIYVSQGPHLEDWQILNFGTSDLAVPGNDQWRMHIKASSQRGLRELRVFTAGGRLIRRFLPNGATSFEKQIDGYHTLNETFFLEAVDMDGHSAISSGKSTSIQENGFYRCADNLNTMPRGKWWGATKGLQNLRGFEDYFACREWVYSFPRFDGIGYAGTRPAIHYHLLDTSRFHTRMEAILDFHYPQTEGSFNPDATDNALLAEANRYFRATSRHTMFTARQNGPMAIRVDTTIEVLQDFDSPFCTIHQISASTSQANQFIYSGVDGTPIILDLHNQKELLRRPLPCNGFAGLYPKPFRGSGAFIALSPNVGFELRANGQNGNHNLYAQVRRPGNHFRQGEIIQVSILTITSQLAPSDDASFLMDFITNFGVDGKAPAYQVKPTQGRVTRTGLVLELEAQDHGFLAQSAQTSLPLNLPVTICGLNPNWDAGILYKGKAALLIPEGHKNDYHQRYIEQHKREYVNELYHIPVLPDGKSLLQLDTNLGSHDLFIGNLLTADNPQLRLLLLDHRPEKVSFEAHNPTDTPITATVRPAAGLDILGSFAQSVTVAPGSSQIITVH